jgi:hypothetical protein
VGDEAGTEEERISPYSVRPARRCSPFYAACLYKSVQVGMAKVMLMNRSMVASVHYRLPQEDRLSSDTTDDLTPKSCLSSRRPGLIGTFQPVADLASTVHALG